MTERAAPHQIGIVLCCHGEMAAGMRSAAEMIVGPQSHVATIAVRPADGREDVERALAEAVADVDCGLGTLVMTDIPGGTPCLQAARLRGRSLELVAGVNLPGFINALMQRGEERDVRSLAARAAECGRKHVVTGDELFSSPGAK